MRILLAEDDPNIVTIAKLALESMGGHTVEVASDGEMALQLLKNKSFDVALMDEMMPKKGGIAVYDEYIKEPGATTPIIFMSANPPNGRGHGFISKPFDPLSLNQNIENILAKKSGNQKP